MRGGSRVAGFLGIAVLVASLSGLHADGLAPASPEPQLTPHDPILIQADAQFTAANGVTGGSGTASDPYVIEGWDISAASSTGIEIVSTRAFFVIRDLRVHSGALAWRGIQLVEVTQGRIENVTAEDNWEGIRVESSATVTVGRSTARSNHWSGITVQSSVQVFVLSNRVSENGVSIRVIDSPGTNVQGNDATGSEIGVGVYGSRSILTDVSYNLMAENARFGMYASDVTNLTIAWNEFYSNADTALSFVLSQGRIHHNRFFEGERGGDSSASTWDDGYPNGGNWWSDYPGRDLCR